MDLKCLMDSELIEMMYFSFMLFNLFCSCNLFSQNCGIVLIPVIWTFFSTLLAQVWLSVTLLHMEMNVISILSEQNMNQTVKYMYKWYTGKENGSDSVLYRKGHTLYDTLKHNNNG